MGVDADVKLTKGCQHSLTQRDVSGIVGGCGVARRDSESVKGRQVGQDRVGANSRRQQGQQISLLTAFTLNDLRRKIDFSCYYRLSKFASPSERNYRFNY